MAVRALEALGIRYPFGIPGVHNTEIYDELNSSEQITPILVTHEGGGVTQLDHRERISVTGLDARDIGRIARDNGLWLAELRDESTSLEDAYMSLTADQTDYRAGVPGETGAAREEAAK